MPSPAKPPDRAAPGVGATERYHSQCKDRKCPGASAMVCYHWKYKGWCKLSDKCKFAHPECRKGAGRADGVPQPFPGATRPTGTAVKKGRRGGRRGESPRHTPVAAPPFLPQPLPYEFYPAMWPPSMV